jgi:Domain of unknown function (DUF4112)
MDRSVVRARGRSALDAQRDRSARLAAAERRITWVSRILDDLVTVPGTDRRVGLEPVVGLIPGAGDLVSAAVGVWLIVEATRFRLPGVVVLRMILNTVVDFVVGLVPFLGDAFDFVFKSNTRNVALFRQYASDPQADTREHRLVVVGLLVTVVGMAWLFIAAIGWAIGALEAALR